jgi:hypothetical protein
LSVRVTGAATGTFTNTTDNVTSSNGGTGGTASATLRVLAPALAPHSRILGLGQTVQARALRDFRGTATPGSAPVASVAIALLRISGGAIAARTKKARCFALSANGRLIAARTVKGKCVSLLFLKASGTTKWKFHLKRRLPKGTYVLTSRATDRARRVERSFSVKAGNRVRFTVT